MRIGKVIGRVTHSVVYPTLAGGRFVILEVQDRFSLAGQARKSVEALVAYDNLGVGDGDLVCFTESREACAPFYPEKIVPLDALVTGILDHVVVELDLT
ncbi:MAG: carbon dioxide concentrating mechanism protein CcmL [Burkholderiales bacterium]|nr:carbon dioxide concentrating mechanism protein CcmL [Phycisphaerae bacterium]